MSPTEAANTTVLTTNYPTQPQLTKLVKLYNSLQDNKLHAKLTESPSGRLQLLAPPPPSTNLRHGKSLRLPPEALDLIMKHLYFARDLSALYCSAIACSSWLRAARPYILKAPRALNEEFMSLIEVTLMRSPEVATWIQALGIGDPRAADPFIRNDAVSAFLLPFCDMPYRPVNLLALDMFGVVEVWDALKVKKISAGFPAVMSLSLARELRHLSLEHCATVFNGRSKIPAMPQLYDPALTALEINDRNTFGEESLGSFLRCLLGSRSKHTLRWVKFRIGEEAVQPVGEFLWEMGPHLEGLEFGFWLDVDTISQLCTKTLQYIDLSHNTALRTLALHDPSFPLIRTLLRDVRATTLTTLTLHWGSKGFLFSPRASLFAEDMPKVEKLRCVYEGEYDGEVDGRMRAVFGVVEEKGAVLVVVPSGEEGVVME
ncbi:hypothetical protein EIP91_002480 [Steccherinum ochraceum]|uniref:F-box domain-containing protein n=1 Tax=Steccherinum ochraceum TaxID=92696 RepID=A0A4R0RC08_9APHY|nr:hypothetical protein EIP91_002480 [Steccherinum ochraceum]